MYFCPKITSQLYITFALRFNALILGCKSLLICSKKTQKGN